MRLLDVMRSRSRDRRELEELRSLYQRLCERGGEKESVSRRTALPSLAGAMLDFEGVFSAPGWAIPEDPTPAETVRLTQLFTHLLALREGNRVEQALHQLIEPLADNMPTLPEGQEDLGLSVSLLEVMHEPRGMIDALVRRGLSSPFPRLKSTLEQNLMLASGIDPGELSRKRLILPIDAKETDPAALTEMYLQGTPYAEFLQTPRPFKLPFVTRFEHTHIVGGSGHGKTQLLQHLILHDLNQLCAGHGCTVVIDSQGDMIKTITRLSAFRPGTAEGLADRLILIDPNDIEHPPCLNLFDFGLDRLRGYSAVEREKLLNGAIALYEYMFGALLGAELTQRQGVIFRYLGRLLMSVPGATIHTLLQFMENPEAARPHFSALEGSARHFFETQFASKAFSDTRQQILNRLWGILSNAVLERMFSNERNKINIFDAMNSGKVILINTAKDLLKQDGCAILGRFFIALIAQAAQERSAIPADKRLPTFLYIDEAQDYFDESIEQLFNQARKYKVGLIIAHQNLDQFEHDILASVMASTAIKLAGGMSAKDASALAKEMRCAPELLQSMRKRQDHSEFACFVKNLTSLPLRLSVPFGTMERQPRLTDAEYEELLARNRLRYTAGAGERASELGQLPAASGFELGRPEVF